MGDLSVALLCSVCEHFDIDVKEITIGCKVPYLTLLKGLIESCECFSDKESLKSSICFYRLSTSCFFYSLSTSSCFFSASLAGSSLCPVSMNCTLCH